MNSVLNDNKPAISDGTEPVLPDEALAVEPSAQPDVNSQTTGNASPNVALRGDAEELVIIGNGMVGYRVCQQLVERGAHQRFRITVLGEEPRPAYDRVNLTEYLRGRDEGRLQLAPREWYASHGITLHLGDPATALDRSRREVATRAGRVIHYDQLVFATGSAPFVPRIEGVDSAGVFVYRSIEDLQRIRERAAGRGRAAVIGGGLLGLEAARALMELGLRVHVIEQATGLMPQQLDPANAAMLHERARSLHVQLHLSTQVQSIAAGADVLRIHLSGNRLIEVDLVVVAAGIRPRDELARAAGLEVGVAGGGVIVDDRLRSSDARIYAVGECARHRGRIYGLAAPGFHMAGVLAANLTGGAQTFEQPDESTRLKMLGVDLAVLGDYRDARQSVSWTSTGRRRQLLLDEGRLVGAVVIGEWAETARIQEAVEARRRVSRRRVDRFRRTGDLWPEESVEPIVQWRDEAIVCNCMRVTCGSLRSGISAGCASAEALSKHTGAATVCGSCKPLIAQLLGSPSRPETVAGSRALLLISIAALGLALLIALLRPLPFADSVLSVWHGVDVLWRDAVWKQITGYTLLGLTVLGLSLSLRKRIRRFKFGSFGHWRVLHSALGATGLVGLVAHTGLRLGSGLNFALMCCFLGVNVTGAANGIAAALESRGSPIWSRRGRQWRPWLTWGHIVFFWPLPVLIAFHILSVYYF
ncbi:MAG: FAD-dependent oxidoreductase [Phycisphaeraceae bacterium]